MNCYDIRDELANGTLDIGVFYGSIGGFKNTLISYPIKEHPLALVAVPEIKKQFSDFITPNQTFPIPLITAEKNAIFRQRIENYFLERNIQLNHTIELWSISTIITLVKSGIGISYLPRFTVQQELDKGTLVEIPIKTEQKTLTSVCAHHKNKRLSPLMDMFLELCGNLINS